MATSPTPYGSIDPNAQNNGITPPQNPIPQNPTPSTGLMGLGNDHGILGKYVALEKNILDTVVLPRFIAGSLNQVSSCAELITQNLG